MVSKQKLAMISGTIVLLERGSDDGEPLHEMESGRIAILSVLHDRPISSVAMLIATLVFPIPAAIRHRYEDQTHAPGDPVREGCEEKRDLMRTSASRVASDGLPLGELTLSHPSTVSSKASPDRAEHRKDGSRSDP